MKTKTQVLQDNPNYTKLINAVIRQLGGMENISDINRHGIDGGFSGFIYYSDTHKFAMRNRDQIVELLYDMADQIGVNVEGMVSNFGVFRNSPMDADEKRDLFRYLGGGKPEGRTITNLMAWFAAEEVCRMFEE